MYFCWEFHKKERKKRKKKKKKKKNVPAKIQLVSLRHFQRYQ